MPTELTAALCLVVIIEGMLLFVAPGFWKQVMAQMLEKPDSALRRMGGLMLLLGVVALQMSR